MFCVSRSNPRDFHGKRRDDPRNDEVGALGFYRKDNAGGAGNLVQYGQGKSLSWGKNLGTEKIKELKPLLESLKEVVKERYKAEILGIFGSYSRGEEREQSDLDILVRFEEDADLIHFIGLSLFLEEKLSLKVDVVPYDAIRKELKDIILRETVYL